jgi:GNAT superfamily N-acetyltransferase
MTHDRWMVIEITTEQTHPLRRVVLRTDTPTDEVRFAEDDWPGVRHLGIIHRGELVGTSTWVPRPWRDEPERPGVQLRGMATARALQGRGIGAALVEAGCRMARDDGAALVWANARDAALAFYTRHGFEVRGDGFVDETTQLPHHVVLRRL